MERLATEATHSAADQLPLVVRPHGASDDLVAWARDHAPSIETDLRRHGGILFRDFQLAGSAGFREFIRTLCDDLMPYRDRATPRTAVDEDVYTATNYPPEQEIFLHNESSFASVFPRKIFFYCRQPAEEGGETPIADVRRVFHRLDAELRNRFLERGVRYVRHFGGAFGLSWKDVFQADDPEEVSEYCRRNGIDVEWKGKRMRAVQVRPAAAKHPATGEPIWFNHAATLHVSTVEPGLRGMLLKMFKEEDLPNNTYYGDGEPIEPEVLDALREAYHAETVTFKWQRGDVLMLDNMLVAHGRRSYVGQREVLTGMAQPTSWDEIDRPDPEQT